MNCERSDDVSSINCGIAERNDASPESAGNESGYLNPS
tara:strand:+ start:438 stop:551 length:114 start_codon:yes stop_codon:yes gene_type:complete